MDLERAKRLYGDIVRERAFNPIHTTNAYFWLGICALMENDLVRAYQAFLIVRKKFKDYGHWAVRLNVGRCEQYIALLDDARSGSLLRRVRATLLLNSVRLRRGRYPWFLIFFLLPLAFVVDTFVRSRSAQARGGWEDYPLLAGLFGFQVSWRVGIWILPGLNAAVLLLFFAVTLVIGDDVLLGLLTSFVTLLAAMAVTLWITLLHRVNLDLAQKRPPSRGGRVVLLVVAIFACLFGGLWLLSLWRYLTWDPYRWRVITQAWRLR
ncbi:MAG: hypothetical protein D6812_02000 [Deltaproteobacteria bacterium]|nr:MAG: hypothetical protein D6812_02000 [Deltaproteobacteria bacterium]